MGRYSNQVIKLSANTNQIDVSQIAKDYLKNAGLYNRKAKVGTLEIWCKYDKSGAVVKAGPTKESVEA